MLGLLVAAAIAVRGLGAAVLTEAGKSLGYRLEYWQSTWAMIRDYPWLGCGPGNFQDCYLHYKLPQASEEIVDPHNLFLEIWATAGTPAILALLALFATFAWQTWRRGRAAQPGTTADEGALAQPAGSAGLALPIAGGAAAGLLLAHFVGSVVGLPLDLSKVLAGLAVGGAALAGLWPWVRGGRLAAGLVPMAVVVLVIHLSASGGMSFPGVAYSLWILLALGVNQTAGAWRAPALAENDGRPWAAILAVALAAAGAVACYLSAYGPVLRSIAAMYRAQDEDARARSAAHATPPARGRLGRSVVGPGVANVGRARFRAHGQPRFVGGQPAAVRPRARHAASPPPRVEPGLPPGRPVDAQNLRAQPEPAGRGRGNRVLPPRSRDFIRTASTRGPVWR